MNATVSVFIETLVVVLHNASYESRLILEYLDTALCKSPGLPFGSPNLSNKINFSVSLCFSLEHNSFFLKFGNDFKGIPLDLSKIA